MQVREPEQPKNKTNDGQTLVIFQDFAQKTKPAEKPVVHESAIGSFFGRIMGFFGMRWKCKQTAIDSYKPRIYLSLKHYIIF